MWLLKKKSIEKSKCKLITLRKIKYQKNVASDHLILLGCISIREMVFNFPNTFYIHSAIFYAFPSEIMHAWLCFISAMYILYREIPSIHNYQLNSFCSNYSIAVLLFTYMLSQTYTYLILSKRKVLCLL